MATVPIQSIALPGPASEALLGLHRLRPDRYPVLLESAATGTPQGRFTLLLGAPGARLVRRGDGSLEGPGTGGRFLQRLEEWWARERIAPRDRRWPFAGGWFLLLGYELAGEVEPGLRLPASPDGLSAVAWRMRAAVIHDHAAAETVAVTEPGHGVFCQALREDLRTLAQSGAAPGGSIETEEEDPSRFERAVESALGHIAAGDIYQANLSRRWTARLPEGLAPAELYARLRRANPGPFSGIANLGELAVVSSSPERLVRVRGDEVETRPIAGTRPRIAGAERESISELLGHPKERAEHIMLVDLARNDLGRLCSPGTVEVDELMSIETYAHVHHIVSNVRGRMRAGTTPAEVIRALFPGGTITGCPKVRCMQLIAELEREGRGAYTGSMGYLDRDGDLDLNILIRTLTVSDGTATLRAGSGIVADSDVGRELEETRAKARGVLRALSA
ncbi:MAG: hypothetical protein AMJ58_06040 [Gammaproteobacteria bacterium SG8_30]|nr:MAG: hypothetical protein AMJ58_06040 [Gammaproteobacteria bacterium SG8_30]